MHADQTPGKIQRRRKICFDQKLGDPKLYTKLRGFFSFRPTAREKIQRRRKMHFHQKDRAIHPNFHRHAVFAKSYSSITTTISVYFNHDFHFTFFRQTKLMR